MALTAEEKRQQGVRAAKRWIQQRRDDPNKMKAWLKAMQDGRKRKEREKKLAAKRGTEASVAKRKKGSGSSKGSHWMQDPKLARAAAKKGHLTRKRRQRERAREQAAQEAQQRIVEHHSAEDLVHLEFPVAPGTRMIGVAVPRAGHDGDDPTQITPAFRKQLALEGLRFVKILLE